MTIIFAFIGIIVFLIILVCVLTILIPKCIKTYFEIQNYIYKQNNKTVYTGFSLSSSELLLVLKGLNQIETYSFGNEHKELNSLIDKITKILNDENVYHIDL